MRNKIVLCLAVAVYVAWLFRWQPIGQSIAVLDRWTGNVVIPKLINENK